MPLTHASPLAQRGLSIATALASLLGWHALANLLDAIPDSNDDFNLF
ncbi:hypothetical protein [Paraburkholderia antibiotica]|uniref:Uncharacterized protein n=1 Tax=Paraburkholderia antibiotica TaxID=2728839 RepID=A0A7X9X234_9BURK|nr:hypothetical protein [Paraburkholderia antibiotica]NML30028.1 hypothetical protein [Paraburkholderia antibiotica]